MASESEADARPPGEFLNEVSNFTLRACMPFYWHDRRVPSPKDNSG